MNQYMIEMLLPTELNDEFISMIPDHRERINRLMQLGTITSYALAGDRSRVWATTAAETEAEVWEMLDTLPLRRFMSVQIYPLMFHQTLRLIGPRFSLN